MSKATSQATKPGRLSTLDQVLAAVDTLRRPSDFGIVLHFKKAPTLEALRTGARSARNLYPVTGSAIDGNRWKNITVQDDGVSSAPPSINAAELFLSQRIDLRKQAPIRQLLVTGLGSDTSSRSQLVTHIHHAAADGISVSMWLHHQLNVASGMEPPTAKRLPFEPVAVRHCSASIQKRAGYHGPSQRLWTRSRQSTGLRRWLTIELPASPVDALTAAAYGSLTRWNYVHGASSERISIWLPVNIRQRQSSGFGNGTSRIRIRPCYSDAMCFADQRREIRRQIQWTLRHGEWSLPTPRFMYLPRWLSSPLLNLYLNRPWADMGTIAFSVAENWSGHQGVAFHAVEKIECVGQLHERHALAINGVCHGDRTWLTFTYDPGKLTACDVRQLADIYREQLMQTEKELA